ncbi:MAG TPA: R3H domain-containing nucleic acid-binding protein [Burkholderiales bacterium]
MSRNAPTSTETIRATDDVPLLLGVLPDDLREAAARLPSETLVEIVMDLGRPAEARFPEDAVRLAERPVGPEDIAWVLGRIGEFTEDNRAGIERTLHRISAIRNRKGAVVGLTLRVGRAIFGTIDILRDLLENGRNLLLLGRPGIGKTTLLREAARVLADDLRRRVIVIDTSNEIAGDGDIPHPAIGSARRMQVPRPDRQHAVMIEAVENHMPQVIIVDEIGTEAEAAAARTIAERGVQLIGTAHGNTLENLVMNPTLSDLVGGVHTVTLSDEEARRRGTYKTINERRAPPTFDTVVEIIGRNELLVHRDTARAVDRLLEGRDPGGERRLRTNQGEVRETRRAPAEAAAPPPLPQRDRQVRIYPYALSRDLLERGIRELRLNARATNRPEHADMVVALRSRAGDPRLQRMLQATGLPLHVVKSNTSAQMRRLLQNLFNVVQGLDEEEVKDAVREVEHAIRRVLTEGVEVALAPRRPMVRKMQHRMIARYHLEAQSEGKEPLRHLVIHPPD